MTPANPLPRRPVHIRGIDHSADPVLHDITHSARCIVHTLDICALVHSLAMHVITVMLTTHLGKVHCSM